jgi:hypothetical protein
LSLCILLAQKPGALDHAVTAFIGSNRVNGATTAESADVFLIDDKWRADNARDQPTMKMWMVKELFAIANTKVFNAIAEDFSRGQGNEFNRLSVHRCEGVDVAGVVCIELSLGTLLWGSIGYVNGHVQR